MSLIVSYQMQMIDFWRQQQKNIQYHMDDRPVMVGQCPKYGNEDKSGPCAAALSSSKLFILKLPVGKTHTATYISFLVMLCLHIIEGLH